MSINDLFQKIKPFYTLFLIILVASIFFALGRFSVLEGTRVPIKVCFNSSQQTGSIFQAVSTAKSSKNNEKISELENGLIIGSKNSKKYYFPWCGTVKMIKPENQVNFSSIEEARMAGYFPAANCKGLK